MKDIMIFSNREDFRTWLYSNCLSKSGIWILFRKSGGKNTINSNEALEEALCFGWIDGQMKNIDNETYKKYFCMRRNKSKWSEKNKKLTESLEERGLMTEYGRKKIEEAKNNGQWNASKSIEITEEHILKLYTILKEYEPAYTNFKSMPPSVKKTYAKAYFAAKTANGRKNRIAWMIYRLNKNLKPM